MIDQNLLFLSILPVTMIGVAIWALYLNRLTPAQQAERRAHASAQPEGTAADFEKLRRRIERVEEEQRRDMRLIAYGRATSRLNHKVRPEAKAALSRIVLTAAE